VGKVLLRQVDAQRRKNYPSASLSTTNPTTSTLGRNQDSCGEKPATKTTELYRLFKNVSEFKAVS